jgi:methionyl-tRNA formyltransferase
MRIIGISSLAAPSRFFFSRLAVRHEVAAVIHVMPPERNYSRLDTKVLAGKFKRFRKAPWRKVRTRLDQLARLALSAVRPNSETSEIAAPGLIELPFARIPIPADQLNTSATVAVLGSMAPDVLVTHGAPVLEPSIFNTALVAALNVHYGISPEYRGENTVFWALYHRDFDKVGVTIHELDKRIDTGRVLAYGYPALEPLDSVALIEARCTDLATELTLEVLQHLKEDTRIGQAQTGSGRLYRYADRTIVHDLCYVARRRLFREQLPRRVARRKITT